VGSAGFKKKKRDVVVTTIEQYPNLGCLLKSSRLLVNTIRIGENVKIDINLRG
jgi:hypothetical protein